MILASPSFHRVFFGPEFSNVESLDHEVSWHDDDLGSWMNQRSFRISSPYLRSQPPLERRSYSAAFDESHLFNLLLFDSSPVRLYYDETV